MKWWQEHHLLYLTLVCVAKRILAIPASSAPTESRGFVLKTWEIVHFHLKTLGSDFQLANHEFLSKGVRNPCHQGCSVDLHVSMQRTVLPWSRPLPMSCSPNQSSLLWVANLLAKRCCITLAAVIFNCCWFFLECFSPRFRTLAVFFEGQLFENYSKLFKKICHYSIFDIRRFTIHYSKFIIRKKFQIEALCVIWWTM